MGASTDSNPSLQWLGWLEITQTIPGLLEAFVREHVELSRMPINAGSGWSQE
jgi:hypothetical protein